MVEVSFGKLKDPNKSMTFAIQPPASRTPPQTLPIVTAIQPYAVITVNLNTARSSATPIGAITLPDGTTLMNWGANTLVVTALTANATVSIGVGDSLTIPVAAGCMTGSLGMRLEAIPFSQIYIVNTSQSASLELVAVWVDQT